MRTMLVPQSLPGLLGQDSLFVCAARRNRNTRSLRCTFLGSREQVKLPAPGAGQEDPQLLLASWGVLKSSNRRLMSIFVIWDSAERVKSVGRLQSSV